MGFEGLKYEKGGYNKEAVLRKIDAYTALLVYVKQGRFDRESTLAELKTVRAMEITREPSGFFGRKGFSVKDTDDYLADVEKEINQLIKVGATP